ncbi:GMC family oxidoreductase [Sciscionella marina]|uniref:GMC family oxidoreductase n=1 Tax=Sciscionella marina TaxID=508770 RepID=UPI00059033B7|nr:GMC family oxidoreductase N-terminal domain-containing protein [Sciscionella marina]
MHDHVIVGAGTAGCVLAARLSADPARSVLLLEAGPDFTTDRLPATLRTGTAEEYAWDRRARVCGDRVEFLSRGKVIGGSAQINGRGAFRAPLRDFAAIGLPEWSPEHVLESYRRIETDLDFSEEAHHGAHGPVPITRWRSTELTAANAAFLETVLATGTEYQADMNHPRARGIGPYPQNRAGRERRSSADTYLAGARDRPNLTVRGDATVDRVLLRGDRATGVLIGTETITARQVVLCAGSPGSPELLRRSGIGHPGIGARIYDQPGAVVPALPHEPPPDWPGTQLVARLGAIPGYAEDDAFYLCLHPGPPPGGGDPLLAIMIGDMRPRSRGRLTTEGLDLGFYREETDLARMRAAYRYAWELTRRPPLSRHIKGIAMLTEEDIAEDERLDAVLRAMTFSRLTLLGGAAMGLANDPDAVVDAHGAVYGVNGLRVCDLSVIPIPLCGTTALEAMLVAERMADWIAAEI